MTIMVVEDEPSIAGLWARYLRPLADGVDIRMAGDLADALRQMAKLPPPDLVLLDLKMPGTTPENTLRHIADLREHNPNAVVLVITGVPDETLPEMSRRMGANDFAQKTAVNTQDALLAAIRRCYARLAVPDEPAFARSLEILTKLNNLTTPLP